ncbi:MAG TPA: pimeloyl-ACP methyl ester esterase BioH [Steroidobacteraceae bacterium]|nr:pimeloyl-ACP methyl ester esterase BioH [Steroidobacteraceae bacterium]
MSLYFEISGAGPDLVLLHGWGLNLKVWDRLRASLSNRFRTIALDLPGHGRSPWSPSRSTPAEQTWLIHETLASVSTRYTLVGWSLGGQIALDLAAATPSQVEKLVLIATTPKFTFGPGWEHGMPAAALTRMAAQLQDNYKRTVSKFLELQVRGSAHGDAVLAELRSALAAQGEATQSALTGGLERLTNADLRDTLPHVAAPTLVIAGQHDRITPASGAKALARALPNGRYVEIRRAAHAPFLSHTKDLIRALDRFLLGDNVETAEPRRECARG